MSGFRSPGRSYSHGGLEEKGALPGTNCGESPVILIAVAFGLVLPLTPVQILWVNMVTAVTLALALAFEPAEKALLRRRQ